MSEERIYFIDKTDLDFLEQSYPFQLRVGTMLSRPALRHIRSKLCRE